MVLEQLGVSAGIDPAQDRYYAGYLAAIDDFLKMDIVEETQDND